MGTYFLAGILLFIFFEVRSKLTRIANALEDIQEYLEYGDDRPDFEDSRDQ